jgi:hypothetical protein
VTTNWLQNTIACLELLNKLINTHLLRSLVLSPVESPTDVELGDCPTGQVEEWNQVLPYHLHATPDRVKLDYLHCEGKTGQHALTYIDCDEHWKTINDTSHDGYHMIEREEVQTNFIIANFRSIIAK